MQFIEFCNFNTDETVYVNKSRIEAVGDGVNENVSVIYFIYDEDKEGAHRSIWVDGTLEETMAKITGQNK